MLTFLLKSSFVLLALWPAAALLLHFSNRFQLNRWVLLMGMLATVALPFVSFESPMPAATAPLQTVVAYYDASQPILLPDTGQGMDFLGEETGDLTSKSFIHYVDETATSVRDEHVATLLHAYAAGAGLIFFLLLLRLIATGRAFRQSDSVPEDRRLRLLRDSKTGQAYAFGPHVFLSLDVMSGPDADHVITHELVHARQWHTFDVLVGELFLALLWFHPAAWWLRSKQRANLEFLTDRAVLNAGSNRRDYQLALVRQSQAVPAGISLSLPFSEPSLKSRITMMRAVPTNWFTTLMAAMLLCGWLGFAYGLVGGEAGGNAGAVTTGTAEPTIPPEALKLAPWLLDDEAMDRLTGANVIPWGSLCEPCQYQNLYANRLPEKLEALSLSFRRLPRPDELAQIRGILWNVGRTDMQIYPSCEAGEGYYDIEVSHYNNRNFVMKNIRDNYLYDAPKVIHLKQGQNEGDASTAENPDPHTGYLKMYGYSLVNPEPEAEQFLLAVNGNRVELNTISVIHQNPDYTEETGRYETPTHFGALAVQPSKSPRAFMECQLAEFREKGQEVEMINSMTLSTPANIASAVKIEELPSSWDTGREYQYFINGSQISPDQVIDWESIKSAFAGCVPANPDAPILLLFVEEM